MPDVARGFGNIRREDLLRTACKVIAERGFGHTRTVDIAQAAGVSQALLFYHFQTKERLFAQALSYAARRDLDALNRLEREGGSPSERLRALLRLYSPTGRSVSWPLWIDAWSESLRNPALEEMSRMLDLRWKRALRDIIADGVSEGVFTCPDPDGASWRLISLLDGLALQVTVHRRVLPRPRMTALVHTATATELGVSLDTLI